MSKLPLTGELTVNLMLLRGVARKQSRCEHLQTGHRQSFTAAIYPPVARLVLPIVSSTSVEQHRYQEEVNQSSRTLISIDLFWPAFQKVFDSRCSANFEMLPSAVRGDCVEIGSVVPLFSRRKRPRDPNNSGSTYLYNGNNVFRDVRELRHIHGEVRQLVLECRLEHESGSVPHRIDAPQVARWIQSWVRCRREVDSGN
jgi:hypothetical protein